MYFVSVNIQHSDLSIKSAKFNIGKEIILGDGVIY